jgi:hypothetical protein
MQLGIWRCFSRMDDAVYFSARSLVFLCMPVGQLCVEIWVEEGFLCLLNKQAKTFLRAHVSF